MGFAGGRYIEKGSIIVDLRCRNGYIFWMCKQYSIRKNRWGY